MNKLERIETIEKELEQLKAELKQEEWSPPSGKWFVNCNGDTESFSTDVKGQQFGNEFISEEDGIQRAKELKLQNWLWHLANELNGDRVLCWSDDKQEKYKIMLNGKELYAHGNSTVKVLSVPYFHEDVIEKALEIVKTWDWI